MTDKDEKVLRQTGWDKVKENLLSDAKSYPAWRRQFPNAISTKARYLITGDSEEADKKANRPRRDLDPLALDQDRRTLVNRLVIDKAIRLRSIIVIDLAITINHR